MVLLGDRTERYGLAVDRFLGEHDMVVRPLDHRLGKVQDVSACALMEDGSPVLILDVEDLDPLGPDGVAGRPAARTRSHRRGRCQASPRYSSWMTPSPSGRSSAPS